jgi:hypothetical protein
MKNMGKHASGVKSPERFLIKKKPKKQKGQAYIENISGKC